MYFRQNKPKEDKQKVFDGFVGSSLYNALQDVCPHENTKSYRQYDDIKEYFVNFKKCDDCGKKTII